MDFFRSILSDDPEPESDPINSQPTDDVIPPESDTGGAWSFGDLVKTLTTKSESVFETYKRDLKEFGTELRKESDLFRDVAIRAVNELPEAGTSALDSVLKSTVDIISQVAITNDNVDDNESDRGSNERKLSKFSRFGAKLDAIRRDERTYVEEVDDVEDFEKWKMGFVVGEKKEEIEKLVGENGVLAGIYEKLVLNGNVVDDGTFWFRYFYKVYRMEVQEEMRAKLVKRSLSSFDDDEDLSWDVDDDDEEEEGEKLVSKVVKSEKTDNVDDNVVNVEEPNASDENVLVVEKDEKVDVEESSDVKDSSNVVEKTNEEEDLEWDEIEDLGENDDKKVSHGDAGDKDELRKRLSTAADDDEEDLSWDIEDDDDDDEHVKDGNK
ncbi:BSD domain-containing protein [Artemisia annua]|uniref:BSD domain-containing protein n=1 Tax=Artemisia annua TaxID=35608 RepID=A0A2U1MSP1_ARTAN|nr:BSD domain-containing protein [Artemisia annua]